MAYYNDAHREDREYYDPSTYIPQLQIPVMNNYEFYSQQQVHRNAETNPVVPYGWRPDWSYTDTTTWNVNPPPIAPSSSLFRNESSYNTANSQLSEDETTKFGPKPRKIVKPFRCQTCHKAFSQAANLTAHRRIHTGEKPFTCPICHRPFSQSSSLVTHRRTHTGEKPYPCLHCDKSFTDSSTLTKHLRTHTGQKPYGCSLCLMRFTQSGNLHRHMKTHKMT